MSQYFIENGNSEGHINTEVSETATQTPQPEITQPFEDDVVGRETLQVISEADAFNAWMYGQIKPYIKGRVVEIGSGIGNISQFLIGENFHTLLSDFNPLYLNVLNEKFGSQINFLGAQKIDLVHPSFDEEYASLIGTFDTLVTLNVVEHINEDYIAIQNCKKLLTDKGHLIVLVPSYSFLYSKMDEKLGHYRRYTRTKLIKLFERAEMTIVHSQYFNFAGIFAWLISAKLLRKDQIGSSNMKLFNQFVPLFKVADRLMGKSLGLSTIVVGQKQ